MLPHSLPWEADIPPTIKPLASSHTCRSDELANIYREHEGCRGECMEAWQTMYSDIAARQTIRKLRERTATAPVAITKKRQRYL